MVNYIIIYTKKAQKDALKLKESGLKDNAMELLEILQDNPLQNPPQYEKLVGDLSGAYSRRINIKHRLVYTINDENKTVKILRMWSHYDF
jgi:toxin YoeB